MTVDPTILACPGRLHSFHCFSIRFYSHSVHSPLIRTLIASRGPGTGYFESARGFTRVIYTLACALHHSLVKESFKTNILSLDLWVMLYCV